MEVFDIDVSALLQKLNNVKVNLKGMGTSLDSIEKKSNTAMQVMASASSTVNKAYETLERRLTDTQKNSAETVQSLENLRASAVGSLNAMVTQNQKAALSAAAYADKQGDLHRVLGETDSLNRLISHQRKLNGLYETSVLAAARYSKELEHAGSSEAKNAASGKILLDTKIKLRDADAKAAAKTSELRKQLEMMDSETGKTNRLLQQQIALKAQAYQAESKLNSQIQQAQIALSQIGSEKQRQLSQLKQEISVKEQVAKATRAMAVEEAKLKAQISLAGSSQGRRLVQLREELKKVVKDTSSATEAAKKHNSQLRAGAQLTAMMRASLQGLNTSIGMYTSSTIIAAASTYALMRAIKSTIVTGAEFQATMARTQAIMGNSVPAEMQGEAFKAMEGQIRAMGRTSQFTASQVAQAVTELGQAGLSAGQAMTALRPTLDLAIIGQLDTARAADHATNIMMIFGKEAKDLSGIVDVMAASVTSANTDVDQLANALTYAGPAADTLGLSLETTAASISVLANAGFKASRAGTALRRLFVSLANPTKKGKEVLDQFNVSVVDLEGNTKDLTDIIGQLSRGMETLTDTEKLAAIQNLVGVYASSPIAALIKQAEALETMDLILRRAGGSAEEMRKKIEAALKFDFKTALSAFEDVQLQLFDKVGDRLQGITIQTAEWLSSLSKPIEADSTITQLDVLMDRVERLIKLGGTFLAVWAARKIWAPLSLSIQDTRKSFSNLRKEVAVTTAGVRAFGAGALFASGAMNIAATAATGLKRALAFIPGIGLGLYTAYTAFDLFFTNNNVGRIKEQEEAVRKYAESYLEVKRNLEEAAKAEAIQAAQVQIGVMGKSVGLIEAKIKQWEELRQKFVDEGASTALADEELKLANRQLTDIKKTITDLKGQTLQFVDEESLSNSDKALNILTKLAAERSRLAYEERSGPLLIFSDEAQARMDASAAKIRANIVLLQKEFKDLSLGQSEAAKSNSALLEDTAKALAINEQEYIALGIAMKKTDLEKHIDLEKQLILLKEEHSTLIEKIIAGTADDTEKQRFEKLTQLLMEQRKQVHLSKIELKDYEKSAEEWIAKIALISETETEKHARLKEELKEIISLREFEQAIAGGSDPIAAMASAKALSEALEKEFNIRSELFALENKRAGSSRGESKASQELKRSIDAAMKSFDALQKKYNAAGAAARDFEKTSEALKLLLKEKEITAKDYSLALQQLKSDYYDLTLSQNENYQTIKRLQDTYLKSPMQKQIEDLAALEKAYEGASKKSLEYLRIRERMMQKIREEVQSSSPTVRSPEVTGPFSDFISTAMGQAEDRKTFGKNEKAWEQGYGDSLNTIFNDEQAELAKIAEKYAHEQEMSAEHQKALKDLEQKGLRDRQAAFDSFNEGRVQMADDMLFYEQQSKKMLMASMAGGLSDMMGMLANAAEEGTTAQKVAFAAQKALAIAQVLLQTHVAVANANATAPNGVSPLAPWIQAQGYASAGLMAALAIGELGGSKKSSGGSSNYAGAYDKGGYIPTGKYGIVGEYGPEIVNGPANVTGREATARKLGGGGDTYNIAPEINIEYKSEGSSSPEQSRQDATMLGNTVKLVVLDTLKNEMRPNGMLYRR